MSPGVYLWRGQTYIGQVAVAAAAGVQPHTVSALLNRHGNLDQLGAGRGNHRSNRKGGQNAVPVARFGRAWPSQAALAAELGVSPSTVQRWVATGEEDRLLAALMVADARKAANALKSTDMIDRFGKATA